MRDKFITVLIDLISVKSIIALTFVGVISFLAIRGTIAPEIFMAIAGCVITYFFTGKPGRDESK